MQENGRKRWGKAVKIKLADGIERELVLDMNALEKVWKETYENPLEASFWSEQTGEFELGEDGKPILRDAKLVPKLRPNLTPNKLKALVWAGIGDPELSLEDVGALIPLALMGHVDACISQAMEGLAQPSPF